MSSSGDSDIEVVLSAQIEQLRTGLNEATDVVNDMAEQMKGSFGSVGGAAGQMGQTFAAALAGGEFLVFQQIAKEALHVAEIAFDDLIMKAERFSLEMSTFARVMGSTPSQIAPLAQSLEQVGVSTERYEMMVMRMEMRMRTQETAFHDLGMATRDHNHDLLQGQDMMQSAFTAMQQYKVGTDQNAFALEVFGRGAKEVYDIMRVTAAQQQQAAADMAYYGLNMNDAKGKSEDFQVAQARLKQQFDDAEMALGLKLMPVLTDFVNLMINVVQPMLKGAIFAFEQLGEVFLLIGYAAHGAWDIIAAGAEETIYILAGVGKVMTDFFSGNLTDMLSDWQTFWDKAVEVARKSAQAMKDNWAATLKEIVTMQGSITTAPPQPIGGDKKFVSPKDRAEAEKAAEAQIQSATKVALEEKAIEEDKDKFLLAMGQETIAQFMAQSTQLENDKYAIQVSGMERLKAVMHEHPVEVAKLNGQEAELAVQHQLKLQQIAEEGVRQKKQIDQQELNNFITNQNAELDAAIKADDRAYEAHQISINEKIADEKRLTAAVYTEVINRLTAERDAHKSDTALYNQYNQQIIAAKRDMNNKLLALDDQLRKDEQKKWDQLYSSVTSSFNSSLNAMLMKTKTWQQALGGVINSVAEAFLQMGEKILEDWIQTQIAKLFITQTTDATSGAGQIADQAAIGAAGAYAATAAIPYIGPELAPEVAATTYGAIMAMEGLLGLGFAAKGAVLDTDRVVQAHAEEMILPAHLSKGIQGLIEGGGGESGEKNSKQEVHLHYNPHIDYAHKQTLDGLLEREGGRMVRFIQEMVRDGSIKFNTA